MMHSKHIYVSMPETPWAHVGRPVHSKQDMHAYVYVCVCTCMQAYLWEHVRYVHTLHRPLVHTHSRTVLSVRVALVRPSPVPTDSVEGGGKAGGDTHTRQGPAQGTAPNTLVHSDIMPLYRSEPAPRDSVSQNTRFVVQAGVQAMCKLWPWRVRYHWLLTLSGLASAVQATRPLHPPPTLSPLARSQRAPCSAHSHARHPLLEPPLLR